MTSVILPRHDEAPVLRPSGDLLRYTNPMSITDPCCLVLCTAPSAEVAAELARGLVQAGLCACVNVLPGVRSFYVWQGELCDDAEVQLFIKTRAARFDEVAAWLAEHHPYDEPEVIAVPIEAGSPGYLAWLRGQTQAS